MNLPPSDKIEQAYTKLSSEEFAVMNKIDIDVVCTRIGKLMRLTPEQVATTALYVTFTILGLYSEKELHEALETEGMSQMQVTEVFSQITDLIISPYLEEVAQLKALDEDKGALEHADAGIEIIDEPSTEETISPEKEKIIETNERNVLAKEDIVIEERPAQEEGTVQNPTESRDAILEDIEHPQKSEGVSLDTMVTKQAPTHTTSIPIRATPTIFETGPMGPSPVVVSPPMPKEEVHTEIPVVAKTPDEAPEGLPVEPDEPTTPVINTIPITTTAPAVKPITPPTPEKKRIENPGPIAINIPTPVIEKTVPVAITIEPVPVVITKEATSTQQQVPTIPSASQEPVFKDIPKVSIVDVGSIAPSKEPEGNPLEQPELLKAAQEHLRQLARERQKGFIAQKMSSTFSLPKTETTVGTVPSPTTDPYRETA